MSKKTYRYKEVSDTPIIGTLYVKKYVMEKTTTKISVEIKEEK
ncbi:MAG: hypothetical protein Q4D26_12855 [Clostridia bacterium]|nr:hypothetical protein [Clostridia bacterium]